MKEIGQRLSLEHRLSLNQLQIQSLELLTLTNMEVQELLEQEYQENPMLEHRGNDRSVYEGPLHYAREIATEDEDICDEIRMQLNRSDHTAQEWRIIEYLLSCLDEKGYCREEPEDVAEILKVDDRIVRKCLKTLRGLEPAGIFSASLEQCLIGQVRRAGIDDPILEEIIEKYLPAVCEGNIGMVTRTLNVSAAQLGSYMQLIRKLDPIPLAGHKKQEIGYIHPDIVCRRKEGQWEIKLTDDWTENYFLSDYYLKLYMECSDEGLKQYLKKKLDRARFIINGIVSRRNTILRILQEIIRRQAGYFERQEGLLPMRMEDIADPLGIHVSTVSRAIKNKYLEHPKGTIRIKDLFGMTIGTKKEEEGVTAGRIKQEIKHIIDHEDREDPDSDQKISKILEEQGILISRRGVAKYRQEMDILSSKRRKELYSIQM